MPRRSDATLPIAVMLINDSAKWPGRPHRDRLRERVSHLVMIPLPDGYIRLRP